jgi:hypothetical protein
MECVTKMRGTVGEKGERGRGDEIEIRKGWGNKGVE